MKVEKVDEAGCCWPGVELERPEKVVAGAAGVDGAPLLLPNEKAEVVLLIACEGVGWPKAEGVGWPKAEGIGWPKAEGVATDCWAAPKGLPNDGAPAAGGAGDERPNGEAPGVGGLDCHGELEAPPNAEAGCCCGGVDELAPPTLVTPPKVTPAFLPRPAPAFEPPKPEVKALACVAPPEPKEKEEAGFADCPNPPLPALVFCPNAWLEDDWLKGPRLVLWGRKGEDIAP